MLPVSCDPASTCGKKNILRILVISEPRDVRNMCHPPKVTGSMYRLNKVILMIVRGGAPCGSAGPTTGFSSPHYRHREAQLHCSMPGDGGGERGIPYGLSVSGSSSQQWK